MNENLKNSEFSIFPLGANDIIYLIGMMGSGKSYWAKQIAATTNCKWIDLDTVIEQTVSKTISEIFATEGENAFRLLEQKVLHQTKHEHNLIVATGGGAPCFFDNIDWMNAHGTTIFIEEPIDILVKRLQKEKEHRPLISNASDAMLHQSLTARLTCRIDFYHKAKHKIIGSKATIDDFIKLIKS